MTLISSKGKAYKPEEWFAVDMNTAVEVCQHIIDGTITQYRVDNTSGNIVKKLNCLVRGVNFIMEDIDKLIDWFERNGNVVRFQPQTTLPREQF